MEEKKTGFSEYTLPIEIYKSWGQEWFAEILGHKLGPYDTLLQALDGVKQFVIGEKSKT